MRLTDENSQIFLCLTTSCFRKCSPSHLHLQRPSSPRGGQVKVKQCREKQNNPNRIQYKFVNKLNVGFCQPNDAWCRSVLPMAILQQVVRFLIVFFHHQFAVLKLNLGKHSDIKRRFHPKIMTSQLQLST